MELIYDSFFSLRTSVQRFLVFARKGQQEKCWIIQRSNVTASNTIYIPAFRLELYENKRHLCAVFLRETTYNCHNQIPYKIKVIYTARKKKNYKNLYKIVLKKS